MSIQNDLMSQSLIYNFVIGVSKEDEQWEVILATHICEQLLEFTREIIPHLPLPRLSNLALKTYKVVEEAEITSPSMFSKYQQKAKRKNKSHARLLEAKEMEKLAYKLVHGNKSIFISIDIEAYEVDHSILLEIGWSMYDAKTNQFMDQHYAIDSYRHLTNGRFVDDQRMHFIFGTTVWCSLRQAFKELRKDLDWAVKRDGGFVLVGHGLDSDLKYLKEKKFMWPTAYGETSEAEDSALVAILNTDVIYGASINDLHNPPSLGKTLNILGVDNWHLHNAGNDAHYTLLLLMKLAKYE